MIRAVLALGLLGSGLTAASAATTTTEAALGTVAAVLQDGYEIRAAFSDNSGGAYVVLQKGTSAYMCHSNPSPRCEKLN